MDMQQFSRLLRKSAEERMALNELLRHIPFASLKLTNEEVILVGDVWSRGRAPVLGTFHSRLVVNDLVKVVFEEDNGVCIKATDKFREEIKIFEEYLKL